MEELIASGIEEVCIVLGSEEERQQYTDFFETRLSDVHYSRLKNELRDYEEKILRIGKRLRYVYQKEKRGFGHAVYQSAEFAGSDPVLLLLGEHRYHSSSVHNQIPRSELLFR